MKKKCIAMLLAGGQGSRLYALTRKAAKPSVPFGGKYRIIDFPLSNCANSGIDTVGVLTQYRPLQLNSYIGNGQAWDLDVSEGGVFILPPYLGPNDQGSWFTGTANAIYQNIPFIESYDPEHVLILSGDHIYKMNYADMLREHVEHGAACTISVLTVPLQDASRFGIMNVGRDGYINEFEEKPKQPKSDLASMGVYIFDWKKLRQYLIFLSHMGYLSVCHYYYTIRNIQDPLLVGNDDDRALDLIMHALHGKLLCHDLQKLHDPFLAVEGLQKLLLASSGNN